MNPANGTKLSKIKSKNRERFLQVKAIAQEKFSDLTIQTIYTSIYLLLVVMTAISADHWNLLDLRIGASLLWMVTPIVILVIWIFGSRRFRGFLDTHKRTSGPIFWALVVSIFLILSNKFAGDLINELFGVDPNHFGISVSTITIIIIPLQASRSNWAKTLSDSIPLEYFYVGTAFIIALSIFVFFFVHNTKGQKSEWISILFAGIVVIFFWLFNAVIFVRNADDSIKKFALWADLNGSHRCTDNWLHGSNGVIFLDGDTVLANFQPPGEANYQKIGKCTPTNNKQFPIPTHKGVRE